VELRLLVATAGILVGLAILLAGVRLLGGDEARFSVRRGFQTLRRDPAFMVSGAVFVVAGVLLIILGGWSIVQAQHEILTMVKPNSTFHFDPS
jgi:ascorbate-specific PTS system EIIC-type component UlaA